MTRLILLLLSASLCWPSMIEAQSHSVTWNAPGPPIAPAPAPQGYYIYRNGLRIGTVSATTVVLVLPDPFLPTDLVAVSAFALDPTTGASIESALSAAPIVCAVGQLTTEYFPNMTLSGTPGLVACESGINHNWGTAAPGMGLPAEGFSARTTGTVTIQTAGTLRLTATADDGVRVFVDETNRMDHWVDQSATTYTVDVPITAGPHALRVEYYEHTDDAVEIVTWALVGAPLDPCVTTPLHFSMAQWPTGTTGVRRPNYSTDRPASITIDVRTTPWTATAIDARGCTVKLVKP